MAHTKNEYIFEYLSWRRGTRARCELEWVDTTHTMRRVGIFPGCVKCWMCFSSSFGCCLILNASSARSSYWWCWRRLNFNFLLPEKNLRCRCVVVVPNGGMRGTAKAIPKFLCVFSGWGKRRRRREAKWVLLVQLMVQATITSWECGRRGKMAGCGPANYFTSNIESWILPNKHTESEQKHISNTHSAAISSEPSW